MRNLVKALKRFDSLKTVIAELEAYDRENEGEITVEDACGAWEEWLRAESEE